MSTPEGGPPNQNALPKVTSIFDFSAEALGELRTWLEQNPPAIPVTQVIGYNTNTVKIYKKASAAQTVASTTTETAVLTETIPAGTLSTTGKFRVTLDAQYLNATGSTQTFTLRIKFGGVNLFGHAISTPGTGVNPYPGFVEFTVENLGATNSNFMSGIWSSPLPGGGTAASIAGIVGGTTSTFPIISSVTSIDTSVAQDVVVTVQHGASSASLTFIRQHYMIETL